MNRVVRLIDWLRAHYLPTFLSNATGPLQRKLTMKGTDPSDPDGVRAEPGEQGNEQRPTD